HSFSCYPSASLRDLPSSPTRRPSDLVGDPQDHLGIGGRAVGARFGNRAADGLGGGDPSRRAVAVGGEPAPVGGEQVAGAQLTGRSEEHTSELQSREKLVCRLLLEKKK